MMKDIPESYILSLMFLVYDFNLMGTRDVSFFFLCSKCSFLVFFNEADVQRVLEAEKQPML